MNKLVIIIGIAVILIGAGAGLYRERQSPPAPDTAAEKAETDTVPLADSGETDDIAAAPEAMSNGSQDVAALPDPTDPTDDANRLTERTEAAEPAGQAAGPSFDAVRVGPSGVATIAGGAQPNAKVTVLDGDRIIGETTADERGDFVVTSDEALPPGSRQLSLRSETPETGAVPSDRMVVMVVPEPEKDIAGRNAEDDARRQAPLALLVPRDEVGASRILQAPAAVPMTDPAAATPPAADVAATPPADDAPPPSAASIAEPSTEPPPPAAGKEASWAPVSIDIVDYDEQGEVIVTGRSKPGSEVRLYLDNKLVGAGRADPQGMFSVRPDEEIAAGTYQLRLDQVDDAGTVVHRAETPFQRADPSQLTAQEGQVVVQPGNSLWRIARRIYGTGVQYTVIYQANQDQIRNPDLIYPGQIFLLPEADRSGQDAG